MDSYPPYAYLEQVLQHCPKAGFTYLKLWALRDVNNEIMVDKTNVSSQFSMNKNKFNNDLLLLVNEGLASVNEYPSALIIELTDWDFDAESLTLC